MNRNLSPANIRNADTRPNFQRSSTTSSIGSGYIANAKNNGASILVLSLFDRHWPNNAGYAGHLDGTLNDTVNNAIGETPINMNNNSKYYASDNQINYTEKQAPGAVKHEDIYSSFNDSSPALQTEINSIPPSSISLPKRKPSVQIPEKSRSTKLNKGPVRQDFSYLNETFGNAPSATTYTSLGTEMNNFLNFSNNDFSSNDISTNDFATNDFGAFIPSEFNSEFAVAHTDTLSSNETSMYNLLSLQSEDNDTEFNGTIKVPKKNKKPEFHLPLDNLNNRNMMFLKLTDMASSSPSDSSLDKNNEHLKIMEPDLGLGYDHDFRANNFHDNITPSMKPPGTNTQEYFEIYSLSDTGGDDNYKNIKVDKDYDALNTGNTTDTSQSDHRNVPHGPGLKNPNSFERPRLNYTQSYNSALDNPINTNFTPTLSGLNFDTNASKNLPDAYRSKSDGPSDIGYEDTAPLNKKNLLVKTQLNYPHLDVQRPIFERADSNQSITSVGSMGSATTKKKRTPKGAVCSICDKYISRDLTRHMRIHDDVGRFRCVYPKSMCNHKTGYFNRPYDYKKHLLHMHFKFDDPKGKTAHTLTDKLPLMGTCQACGARFSANDWLDTHVLTNNIDQKCLYLLPNN